MRTRVALFSLFVLVAGCTSAAWERPGATSDQLIVDTGACRDAARIGRFEVQDTISGSATLYLPVSEIDRQVFDDCMRGKGYVQGGITD